MQFTTRTCSTQDAQAPSYYPTQRIAIAHSNLSPNVEWLARFFFFHLCSYRTTARPCDEDGTFLQAPQDLTPPLSPPSQDQDLHDWSPFEDRIAFKWAYYHYVTAQSSASNIAEGLDLWSATAIKYGSSTGAPWKNAKDMYATIDSIQTGSLPFKTFKFHYTGPKPSTPPSWMELTYELNTRDVLGVVREQLATTDFDGKIDYIPYKEFNGKSERVWSNLMSGHWAFTQAVCVFFFCLLAPHIILGHDLTRSTQQRGHVCPYHRW